MDKIKIWKKNKMTKEEKSEMDSQVTEKEELKGGLNPAEDGTYGELLNHAFAGEKKMMDLYLGLMTKFTGQKVSEFWRKMADDETKHIKRLSEIKASLTPEQLHASADPALIEEAREILNLSVKEKLDSIKTLKDAHQTAHELEYSEINTLYTFLLAKLISSEEKRDLLKKEIKGHLIKIDRFPERFL